MSDLSWFSMGERTCAVRMPFSLERMFGDWQALRRQMIRHVHPAFSRSEWAYLIGFVDPHALQAILEETIGSPCSSSSAKQLLRPVEKIALWLPNNVSLLGPLTLVLLSLTGAEVRVKAGSRSNDLSGSFIDWVARMAPPDGPLMFWSRRVSVQSFDRLDQRNREMAAWADARVFFGGDDAARSIEQLPHPINSVGAYFAHKVSEAWTTPDKISTKLATDLARIFSIYGQAGCTSPKRIVVIDGKPADAQSLVEHLAEVWPSVVPERPARHVASETLMAAQWARADGLVGYELGLGSGVAIISPVETIRHTAHMAISVQWGSLKQVLATQPSHLQSIGYDLPDPDSLRWIKAVAQSPATRFVPLTKLHHFGPVWDGQDWWRNLFVSCSLG